MEGERVAGKQGGVEKWLECCIHEKGRGGREEREGRGRKRS